jgi:hypothetical protein
MALCGALGPLVRVQVERWYGAFDPPRRSVPATRAGLVGHLLPDPGVFTIYQCCSL